MKKALPATIITAQLRVKKSKARLKKSEIDLKKLLAVYAKKKPQSNRLKLKKTTKAGVRVARATPLKTKGVRAKKVIHSRARKPKS